MKRYLVAAGVGTMVFGAALGSAAALNVNGNPVAQYGEDMNLVCDVNGVTVDGFFVESDGVSKSHGIVLSDISTDCNGKTVVATITGDMGQQLAKGFVVVDSTQETFNWAGAAGTAGVPISSIYGVRLTLG